MKTTAVILLIIGIGSIALAWRRSMPRWAAVVAATSGGVLTSGALVVLLLNLSRLQAVAINSLVPSAVASALLLGWARHLWDKHKGNPPEKNADANRLNLSIALGTGAAVALLLTALQLLLVFVTEQERVLAARSSIELAIGVAPDLSGFVQPEDPADPAQKLDLSDYWFRGKKMTYASLQGATLRGTSFVFTDLSGAFLSRAILTPSGKGRADLRAATLKGADLRHANLQGANLTEADLSNAFIEGADFTGAIMDWADLRTVRCGEDTNRPRPCNPAKLLLPRHDNRHFPHACWPGEAKIKARAECGDEARLVQRQRKS